MSGKIRKLPAADIPEPVMLRALASKQLYNMRQCMVPFHDQDNEAFRSNALSADAFDVACPGAVAMPDVVEYYYERMLQTSHMNDRRTRAMRGWHVRDVAQHAVLLLNCWLRAWCARQTCRGSARTVTLAHRDWQQATIVALAVTMKYHTQSGVGIRLRKELGKEHDLRFKEFTKIEFRFLGLLQWNIWKTTPAEAVRVLFSRHERQLVAWLNSKGSLSNNDILFLAESFTDIAMVEGRYGQWTTAMIAGASILATVRMLGPCPEQLVEAMARSTQCEECDITANAKHLVSQVSAPIGQRLPSELTAVSTVEYVNVPERERL
eukprot:Clim_evm48s22 gene=Clim_evmTU48s22